MKAYIGLIPLLPLIGAVLLFLFGKKASKQTVALIGCLTILGAFVLALMSFFQLNASEVKSFTVYYFDWFNVAGLRAEFSFLIDPLSVLMLLVVTGIGFLIHLYSVGYMHADEAFHRFFAYMNLFVFFMLILVMGDNYALMFAGWEGVGLCSYLLIGFWFKNKDYNLAANKAFIMNRIGDLGFVLGIFLLFTTFGSIRYIDVFESAAGFGSDTWMLTAATLLLFVGAMGKSAQIPLYTWLPDAMAGPTPVSALIHAATMVTAGIYMIARSHILYVLAPFTGEIITGIGFATAIFAGSIALAQNDIKKILAYSTVSQLGLMFAALGLNAFSTGMFHLTTHAFFKALLFLGAGSVIHAMSGEQDIRKMGGLRSKLPITFLTFLAGTLALSGIPPFAGFFSKDEIMSQAMAHSPWLMIFGLIAGILTIVYMARLFVYVFMGSFRGTKHQADHLHESPKSMTIPLMALALLSVVGGFIGMPEIFGTKHLLNDYLAPVFSDLLGKTHSHTLSHSDEWISLGISTSIALVTLLIAYRTFSKKDVREEEKAPIGFKKLLAGKYYIDEIYDLMIVKPIHLFSDKIIGLVESSVFTRGLDSFGWTTIRGSKLLKNLQSGHTSFYIFAMVISILLILLANRI